MSISRQPITHRSQITTPVTRSVAAFAAFAAYSEWSRVAKLQEGDHGGRMASSAKLAAADALDLYVAGRFDAAFNRSVDSLEYSVGMGHDSWVNVMEVAANGEEVDLTWAGAWVGKALSRMS